MNVGIKTNIITIHDELEKKYTVVREDTQFIHLFGPVNFPINLNSKRYVFNWYVWKVKDYSMSFQELLKELKNNGADQNYNSILTYGDFENSHNALVRIHSCCLTGDVFGSTRCDCGPQLNHSLEHIVNSTSGAIVYMDNHEGRGIGLYAKAIANTLQELGFDTYEANNILDFEDDERTYDEAISIIKYFRAEKGITLLSNNPDKLRCFKKIGIIVNDVIPIHGFENEDNKRYLNSKLKRIANHIDSDEEKLT
ncbi:GTP cyclohydrolase II [Paenibacillus motobuensis]|uniref:GTP cyclohydrolase II n=1 Tax=Paenibacillus TaxID=44249 RepID=UPI002041C458|nr:MULTISPECIES: GTP cyclohydrolase II [Paenibacillus]MCM3039003.1 GTP cyclohydrolase II [Paenibacillus lutimineralis]MCM3646107.1 GTP cyclohydrolase II [Paenibacillus motobuensis]